MLGFYKTLGNRTRINADQADLRGSKEIKKNPRKSV
jgi:hypothetical protein